MAVGQDMALLGGSMPAEHTTKHLPLLQRVNVLAGYLSVSKKECGPGERRDAVADEVGVAFSHVRFGTDRAGYAQVTPSIVVT